MLFRACSDNVEDALEKLQEILDAAWKAVQPIEEDPEKAKEIKKQVGQGAPLPAGWIDLGGVWGLCNTGPLATGGAEGVWGVRRGGRWAALVEAASSRPLLLHARCPSRWPARALSASSRPPPSRPPHRPQLERGNERRLQGKKMQSDKKKERRAKIDW